MTLIQDQPSAGSAMKPPTSEPGQGRRLFKMLGLRYKFSWQPQRILNFADDSQSALETKITSGMGL
jgi:hypothetical protein